MRSALFLTAGLLFMAGFLILGRLFTPEFPAALKVVTWAFVAAWLLVTAFNMWVGVAHAGYGVVDELPVFLVLFGVPAVVAGLLKWRVL